MRCCWCGGEIIEPFRYLPPKINKDDPKIASITNLLSGMQFCSPHCLNKGRISISTAQEEVEVEKK